MRRFLVVIVMMSLSFIYMMTGLVYVKGGFAGAFVVKPYPTPAIAFGGGEDGGGSIIQEAPRWFHAEKLTR